MTPGADDSRRLGTLIDQWLDDDLGPAESAELEAVLATSPAARRRFWRHASFHAVLHEALSLTDSVDTAAPDVTWRRPWIGRVAGLLLACLGLIGIGAGIGSVVTSQAVASLSKATVAWFELFTEGFERGGPPVAGYIPTAPGEWGGDKTGVCGPSRGVTPCEGARMLEFQAAHPDVVALEGQYSSEIWRIVPVSAIRSALPEGADADGLLTVEFTAAFNQRGPEFASGARDPREVANAGISVHAFAGGIDDVHTLWKAKNVLAVASGTLTEILDDDPAHWQRLRVTVSLPRSADFLVLQCYTGDDKANAPAVFDGQFVDDITLHAAVDAGPGGGDR